eukprot:COSAG02_NODE_13191_length_1429_cov_1.706767_1_plen_46_part_10
MKLHISLQHTFARAKACALLDVDTWSSADPTSLRGTGERSNVSDPS